MSVSLFKLFFGKKSLKGLVLPLFGLLLGISLIPLVLQINHDVKQVLKGGGEDEYQYLQISKKVDNLKTVSTLLLGIGDNNFSESDFNKLKSQSFIEDVAKVTSNNFRVYVKAPQNKGGFDGYMHSVPDNFLDERPKSFSWEVGQDEIPVIISNQFFTLLNTGILPSQGHQLISRGWLKTRSLSVYLGSGNKRIKMHVRVVGFSDRITTVIVPSNFVDWANNNFHPEEESESKMAIIKVKDSGNKDLEEYLNKNDFEVNKEQLVAQKGMWIAQLILVILFTLGLIISLLSINSMVLFVRLVIMESVKKIEMLLILGYKTKKISLTIIKFFSILIVTTALLGFVLDSFVIKYLHEVINKYSSIDLTLNSFALIFFPILTLLIISFISFSVNGVINKFSITK